MIEAQRIDFIAVPTNDVEQAAEFSWDATAEQTLETYDRARSFMREAVA